MAGADQITIAIPSYKRAHRLVGADYFATAVYVVPESQGDEYRKALGDRRVVAIPDDCDGNIARKRNWILRNMARPLLMIDDDVRCLRMTEKRHRSKARQHIMLSQEQAMDVIVGGFNLAHQWQCVFWGINVNTDGRNYQQYKPFSLTQVILGPFQGHLDHGLSFDERMGTKDDYDFSLQVLKTYKKALRINRFAYDCDHGTNEGGIVAGRTMEQERKYCEAIMAKWGKEVIRYRIPPRKMGDLLNGSVRVPIRGV